MARKKTDAPAADPSPRLGARVKVPIPTREETAALESRDARDGVQIHLQQARALVPLCREEGRAPNQQLGRLEYGRVLGPCLAPLDHPGLCPACREIREGLSKGSGVPGVGGILAR